MFSAKHFRIRIDLSPGGEVENWCERGLAQTKQIVSAQGMEIHVHADKLRREAVFGEKSTELPSRILGMVGIAALPVFTNFQTKMLATIVIDVVSLKDIGWRQFVLQLRVKRVKFCVLIAIRFELLDKLYVLAVHKLTVLKHVQARCLLTRLHLFMQIVEGCAEHLRVGQGQIHAVTS